ncbi:MAG: Glu-tRNA(Gln) amidotransferase subunit GatE [Candidatus Micrarchaeia archaeon]
MESGKDIDYKALGFACGLEIHQRLMTREKLFCSCSATLSGEESFDHHITRTQRAVAGELGEIDRAAKFEEEKKRVFRYEISNSNACLVEIDEEPPHPLNMEALDIALSIAKAFDLKLVDELQPMRKGVVDGSNPSAFQRTIMLGSDGKVVLGSRSVPISMMSLEEESAGIEEKKDGETVYSTSRIGIPLVEIDTDASISSPSEAKALALRIGTILRLTGKVQRGIGSIRQDVNVSIKAGARVEIKGVQELERMDLLIENEVRRQAKLVEIAQRLKAAKAGVGEAVDITSLLSNTKVRVIQNQLKVGGVALAFAMWKFRGIVGEELQPDRRLGSEISDYAKMYGVNGIIHSDEDLSSYGFEEKELSAVRSALSIGSEDAFAIISGKAENVKKAAESAIRRTRQAMEGVPLETRGVLNAELGTTRFLRPLPGGSRMYPETDLYPVEITEEMKKKAEANAPDFEKELALLEKQAGKENAEMLALSSKLPLYKLIVQSIVNPDCKFVSNVLLQKFTELRRNGFDVDSISDEKIVQVFSEYSKGHVTKQGVEELLKRLSKDSNAEVEDLIKSKELERISGKQLEEAVKKIIAESHLSSSNEAIGAVMSRMRLNVDGNELNELLKRLFQKDKK